MPLTPKQERFVSEYLVDLNATQAAIRAGYHPKMAAKLVAKSSVADAIATAQRQRAARAGITADRVLEEVRRLALSDVRGLFDTDGNLRPLHELSDEQAAAVASVEVIIKNAAAGDGHTDTVHKIKVWDKPKALEMLMKHLGLFEEQARISGTIELVWGTGHGS